ncbi:MAG: methyltransferase domain-containing protein [Deltaproteobacteria bacterium]|nr:methyltransferase domain-containing protein [Deltaproteobacteria bacterium]
MSLNDHLTDILQCPRCRGTLLWDQEKCSACKAPFRVEDGIFDFVSYNTLSEQNRTQIELHKLLASDYQERYEPEYSKIYSRYWNRQFLSNMPENPQSVLDNGCGTGELLKELLPHCNLPIGSDISKAMIKTAKDSIGDEKDIIWVVSPGESLPFADNIFDVICFRGTLHHMSDEMAALKEAYRILKKNGLVMLSEPNDDSILLRLPRKIANRRMARFGKDHKAFKSKRLLKSMAEMGFSIQNTKYFSFLSQPFCGMSDLIPLMKILPFSKTIAGLLVSVDEICSSLPIIKKQSFDLFVSAKKNFH